MDGSKSKEALAEFLTYLADKGLMASGTVSARKAAASKVLGILEGDEANDVTILDLDDVIARFGRLHGKNYTPESLAAYRSRLKSALNDFKSYLDNPLAFRPNIQIRDKPSGKTPKETQDSIKISTGEPRTETSRPISSPLASSNILPIPIRADLTVYIQGLPFDLSEAEARKIAGVVSAMAMS